MTCKVDLKKFKIQDTNHRTHTRTCKHTQIEMIDEQEKRNKKQENKKTKINRKTYSKNRNNDNNGIDNSRVK